MKAAHGRLSTETSTAHTSRHGSNNHCTNEPLSGPPQPLSQVEKACGGELRRERINSCIEQLKSLLAAEFLQQQPDSKLEKADVLEMTVSFLTQLQQKKTDFLSQSHIRSPEQSHCTELHNHREALFCLQSSTSKDKRTVSSALWRPW